MLRVGTPSRLGPGAGYMGSGIPRDPNGIRTDANGCQRIRTYPNGSRVISNFGIPRDSQRIPPRDPKGSHRDPKKSQKLGSNGIPRDPRGSQKWDPGIPKKQKPGSHRAPIGSHVRAPPNPSDFSNRECQPSEKVQAQPASIIETHFHECS